MKKLILTLLLLFGSLSAVFACEIKMKIDGKAKKAYAAGDTIVVETKLVLTHRVCELTPKQTEFTYKGVKVLGATKWKKEKAMVYVRKLKLKVLNDKAEKIVISAKRTCSKDGGFGTIEIKKVK